MKSQARAHRLLLSMNEHLFVTLGEHGSCSFLLTLDPLLLILSYNADAVTDASDLDAPESSASSEPAWKEAFNPEFTHQFFGEDEIIFGYEDLKVGLGNTTGTGKEPRYTCRV